MAKKLEGQLDLDKPVPGLIKSGKLNELIVHETVRPNGRRRIQLDFEFCPTMAEQHTGHLSNLNYLIERYKPDELAAYMAARNQYRQEILGHDFSLEPSLQDAKNVVLAAKQIFEQLPDDVQVNFKNSLEFIKFMDNPANIEKMSKLGLITPDDVRKLQSKPETAQPATPPTTPAQGGEEGAQPTPSSKKS